MAYVKPDHYDVHATVKGQSHPMRWKAERFERTVEKFDADNSRGKMTYAELTAKYKDHLLPMPHTKEGPAVATPPVAKSAPVAAAPSEKPAPVASKVGSNTEKQAHAHRIYAVGGTGTQIIKRMEHEMGITSANARYYVMKFGRAAK